ncbi:MAG TPA: AAA family ATPase [Candidatus Nanoarchaeia archaeon]|nr:AAA family ATPase [Candidatus Nanoarchaeia archaeon]
MRLKRIRLNNIRSYKNQEIDFPDGSTLLSGDIGSGKTSVLLAFEFALFGLQPGQKATSLLRNGHDSGGVEIEFEVDGRNIVIERTMKRKKTISQDYCSVHIDGKKEEISVMELKNVVLNLLNYPKEFSKKQNTLYKFTVYTPQEEMKQIITEDAETRVNTLRHIFGIDKYKRVIENTSLLLSKIREEKRINQVIASNMEGDRDLLLSREMELETKKQNLSVLEKEFFLKSEERKKFQEEMEKIATEIEESNKLKRETEKMNFLLSNKGESISMNCRLISNLRMQIGETEKIKFDESRIPVVAGEISSRKSRKENLNQEYLSLSSQISSLNSKNRENLSFIERINHIEKCPTCLQILGGEYKTNVSSRIEFEIRENNEKISLLKTSLESVSNEIKLTDSETASLERELNELNILRVKTQSLNEKKQNINQIENLNKVLEGEIIKIQADILKFNLKIEELKPLEKIFDERKKILESLSREERILEIRLAELKRELQIFSLQIEELKNRVKKSEELKRKISYLLELDNWLSEKFLVLVSLIEKNTMTKLKHEFSTYFARWFSMLVSESFNIRVSDDFSPIIEQQDYEIDYSHLSGGERTAIALAYRLALHQVINSMFSNIKTRDIIILDEPTDGFSSQQLDKMRDVLFQLNAKQLIIVSHEQKIEGFVDKVIKFRKENGVSFIET